MKFEDDSGYYALPLVPQGLTFRNLTVEEAKKASDWINERSKDPKDLCAVCGSEKVIIQPAIGLMRLGEQVDGQAWGYPVVVTVCYNCGHTRHFNAVLMGLSFTNQLSEEHKDG